MWVVAILTFLTGLIVFALCIPLRLIFRMDIYGKPKASIEFKWLFGLVKKTVALQRRRPERRRARLQQLLKSLRSRSTLRNVLRLSRDVLRRLKIDDFATDFRLGLDDPADTGLLFAAIGPPTFLLNSFLNRRIRLQPVFDDGPVFEGYLEAAISLHPIHMISPLVRFLFSSTDLSFLKHLLLNRWRKKN